MSSLTIEIPENVLLATGQSREEFIREAKLLLAAKLFELGRLSSGKAAQLCGVGRVDFLLTVSRLGIPVADLDEDDMQREFTDV
jgi:predicted HTH domain antitoxin